MHFYKELLHASFLLIYKKPCVLGKEGIIIILILNLKTLRLALVSKYTCTLDIFALVFKLL